MKTVKSIVTIIIVLMVIVAAKNIGGDNPNETKIQFNKSSIKEILALAKKENKQVFIDISTSWCGYCKRMKANVFTNAEVANYFNSNFINISIDAEKGEGIELAKKYGVRGYPTFVFLNSDGSLAKQTSGYQNSQDFIEFAKNISK